LPTTSQSETKSKISEKYNHLKSEYDVSLEQVESDLKLLGKLLSDVNVFERNYQNFSSLNYWFKFDCTFAKNVNFHLVELLYQYYVRIENKANIKTIATEVSESPKQTKSMDLYRYLNEDVERLFANVKLLRSVLVKQCLVKANVLSIIVS